MIETIQTQHLIFQSGAMHFFPNLSKFITLKGVLQPQNFKEGILMVLKNQYRRFLT
jgi:hypothetical protein